MMYTCVVPSPEKEKSIRLPVSGDRLDRWERMLRERKLEQQDALLTLIDWITAQDAVTQAMVLNQLPARPDLIELVLRNMAPAARTPGILSGATPNRTGATPKR